MISEFDVTHKKDISSVKGKVCLFICAPGMGDNLAVKVRYALGSRKR